MVVQEIGINGFSVHSLKPHLVAHHVNNKVILYVHDAEYVCVLSVLTFHNTQSHRSTIYELEKYLLIFNVLFAAVELA
jgi:hypothetical protein